MDARKENTATDNENNERAVSRIDISDKLFEEDDRRERELERKSVKKTVKNIVMGAVWMIISYMLGGAELPFGAVPFGVALLCSASSKITYIYTGLCFSALWGSVAEKSPLVLICAYTAALFIRVISRIVIDDPFDSENADEREIPTTVGEFLPLLFSEHVYLRMATSCVAAFIIGIYGLARGGFLYYDLFGMLIGMAVAPFAVYLYSGISGNGCALGAKSDIVRAEVSENRIFTAVCTIAASLVFAANGITVLGASVSVFGAMMVTLYYSRRGGIMYGLVTGTLCGIAYSPMLAPVFAFAAIASGALWKVSVFFACLSACSVGIAWGLYVEGISALTTILPATLAAALIFAVADKLYLGERIAIAGVNEDKSFTDDGSDEYVSMGATTYDSAENDAYSRIVGCEVLGKESVDGVVIGEVEEKIRVMSETFSSLSELFYSLSEKMRTPAASDLKQICDNAFECSCQRCDMRTVCWEKEYTSSLSSLGRICSALGSKGHIGKEDVPARMAQRCSAMPDIIDQINRNSMTHIQQLIIGDKTEIFALDYEAVAELLLSVAVSDNGEYKYKEELSNKAKDAIDESACDLKLKDIFAYGNDRKIYFSISLEDGELNDESSAKIRSLLEEVCGDRLELCERSKRKDDKRTVYATARKYKIEYAKRSIKAEGEDGFCGDTLNIFENEKDHFYSFISDGMGSGREAALTSGICSVFLSKILSATSRCDISLEMLNGFLRNKGSGSMHECSATVDLLDLDLITGKAEFYKGGAAPSYVFRDGNLFKLRSNTVPLGIIKELDTKKLSIEVGIEDIIVMVSDGVTQSKDECPWLFELLKANVGKESLASIADMIVKRAKYEGADDDVSVIVMRVGDN